MDDRSGSMSSCGMSNVDIGDWGRPDGAAVVRVRQTWHRQQAASIHSYDKKSRGGAAATDADEMSYRLVLETTVAAAGRW